MKTNLKHSIALARKLLRSKMRKQDAAILANWLEEVTKQAVEDDNLKLLEEYEK